jgi:hypothetical protein
MQAFPNKIFTKTPLTGLEPATTTPELGEALSRLSYKDPFVKRKRRNIFF